MALETLKGIKQIGSFDVVDMNTLQADRPDMFRPDGSMHYHLFEKEIRPFNFIYVRHDVNSISFTIQNGPIMEKGVNGCQVDTIIETAMKMIIGLNSKYPCVENRNAIDSLNDALNFLGDRRKDRESRGVEGYSKS